MSINRLAGSATGGVVNRNEIGLRQLLAVIANNLKSNYLATSGELAEQQREQNARGLRA